jgi:hypothetical protein
MSDTLIAAIVGAIAGIITGSISSLIAPWVNWGFENKKDRRNHRRQLVANWRREIVAVMQNQKSVQWKLENWTPDYHESIADRCELGDVLDDLSIFYEIKPHLSPRTLNKLEDARKGVWDSKVSNALESVLEDINRLEKKWKLI